MDSAECPKEKVCSKCRKIKPLEDFAFSTSKHKYGRYSSCKLCSCEKMRSFRKNRKTKTPTDPEKYLQHRAWENLRKHVSRGKIKRGNCEICNSPNGQAHHWKGYEKEFQFDVKWLCQRHHHLYHAIEKENQEAAESDYSDLSLFFSFAHSRSRTGSLPNSSNSPFRR